MEFTLPSLALYKDDLIYLNHMKSILLVLFYKRKKLRLRVSPLFMVTQLLSKLGFEPMPVESKAHVLKIVFYCFCLAPERAALKNTLKSAAMGNVDLLIGIS